MALTVRPMPLSRMSPAALSLLAGLATMLLAFVTDREKTIRDSRSLTEDR